MKSKKLIPGIVLSVLLCVGLLFIDPRLLDIALISKHTWLSFVAFIFASFFLISRRELFVPKKVQWLLLVFVLFEAISLFHSRIAWEGFSMLTRDLVLLLLLPVLFSTFSKKQDFLRLFFWPLIFVLLIMLLQSTFEFFEQYKTGGLTAESSYKVKSFFAHRNLFAQILVLCIPILLFFLNSKRVSKMVTIVMLCAIVLTVILLFARSAWLALGMIFFVSLIAFVKNWKKFRIGKFTYLIIILVAIIGGTSFVLLDSQDLRNQLHTFTDWKYGSAQKRMDVWQGSRELISEKPLLGHGLANWKIEINRFIAAKDVVEDGNVFYQRPHNDFLWIWVESGLLTFIIYLSIFLFALITFFRSEDKFSLQNPRFIGLMGILSYLIFALISFPRERAEHLIFLSVYLYLILPGQKMNFKAGKMMNVMGILVLIPVLVSNFYRYKGEVNLKTSKLQFHKDEISESIKSIENARSTFYRMDALSTPLLYYSGMGRMKTNDFDGAIEDLVIAKIENPHHIQLLNNLGMLYFSKNSLDSAELQFAQVLRLRPTAVESRMNLAMVQYNNKHVEEAMMTLGGLKYKQLEDVSITVLQRVTKSYLIQIAQEEEDPETKNIILNIANTSEWSNIIFEKHIKNQISFKKQLYLDVRYTLENTGSKTEGHK